MRPDVWAEFLPMIEKYEGKKVPFMYLDTKGLVSAVTGKLYDPIELVMGAPFLRPDGTRASWGEIDAEWHYVKSRQDLAPHGGMAFGAVTKLRLSSDAMDEITEKTADGMWARLLERVPDLENWPTTAAAALLGMAWAAGAYFVAPKFLHHANARDWQGCADECGLHTARDGIHRAMFLLVLGEEHGPVVAGDNQPVFILPDPLDD